MNRVAQLLLLFCVSTFAQSLYASYLAEIAEKLKRNSFVKLPDNTSLRELDINYSHFYWADTAVWDPIRKRILWVGGPGQCCTKVPRYELIKYLESDNKWALEHTPFVKAGHAYDANAYDPDTDTLYFSLFRDRKVKVYKGNKWSTLSTLPFSAPDASSITWFPDINEKGALVYVGANRNIALYSDRKWQRIIPPSGFSWGGYHVFSEYNHRHKLVWFGGGKNNDKSHYALYADGRIKKFSQAPISLGVGKALHTYDPLTGNLIVLDLKTKHLWEFNVGKDEWKVIKDVNGAWPPMQKGAWLAVPINEYNVNLFVNHYHQRRSVYMYKN